MNREIILELYRTLLLLGADHQLLGTVGSWADGLDETEVLSNLTAWNEATSRELKYRTESAEALCSHPAYSQDAARKSA